MAAIEGRLRRMTKSPPQVSFGQVVSLAVQRHRALDEFDNDLREWAELRNALVHQRGGGHLIADPHPDVVAEAQAVRQALEVPAKLLDVVGMVDVVRLADSDNVATAAMTMLRASFSQLPIYREGRFVGLLTAETITRWLAAGLQLDRAVNRQTPISELLPHTEDPDNVRFLGPESTVLDGLDAFDVFARSGRSLHAILVTEDMKRDRPPQSIVTAFDTPRLLDALNFRRRRQSAR